MNWKFLLNIVIVVYVMIKPYTVAAQKGWLITGNLQYVSGNYTFDYNNKINFYYSGIGNWNISISVPIALPEEKMLYNKKKILPKNETESKRFNDSLNKDIFSYNYSLARETNFNDFVENSFFPQAFNINTYVRLLTAVCTRRKGEYNYGFSVTLEKLNRNYFWFGSLGYVVINNPMHTDYKNSLSYGFGIGKNLYKELLSLLIFYQSYTTITEDIIPPKLLSIGMNYRIYDDLSIYLIETLELSKNYSENSFSGGLKWHL